MFKYFVINLHSLKSFAKNIPCLLINTRPTIFHSESWCWLEVSLAALLKYFTSFISDPYHPLWYCQSQTPNPRRTSQVQWYVPLYQDNGCRRRNRISLQRPQCRFTKTDGLRQFENRALWTSQTTLRRKRPSRPHFHLHQNLSRPYHWSLRYHGRQPNWCRQDQIPRRRKKARTRKKIQDCNWSLQENHRLRRVLSILLFRVAGLWTGLGPNIIRNSIINAAEIATFDQVKDMILRRNLMEDGIPCHLVSSAIAGFTACIVGSPVDVLKTRLMNAKVGEYSGVLDCIVKTWKENGILSFYKGLQANANRIVTWNIFMFVSLGMIRKTVYNNFYKSS